MNINGIYTIEYRRTDGWYRAYPGSFGAPVYFNRYSHNERFYTAPTPAVGQWRWRELFADEVMDVALHHVTNDAGAIVATLRDERGLQR